MYKITLTGMSGFIGGHLATYLGELGYEVDDISKKEFMAEDWYRLDNFRPELHGKMIDVGTVDDDGKLIKLEKNVKTNPKKVDKPDIVVHCAWPKIDLHLTDHLEFAEASCNFFNECKKRGIRVINLGSSSEYGVKDEPMKEDMICEPINTYGIAKLAVTLYAKKLGFNTLRLFTIVGKGGHDFWSQFKFNKIEKFSMVNNRRDFIDISRVCQAIERLMHAEHIYSEIINVASGKQIDQSFIYLADGDRDKFNELLMRKEIPEWTPEEAKEHGFYKYPQSQYEPPNWSGSTTKLKKLLNL